jgi:signal transduction histidine kinase/ligand-binding sensor domain-containing protein/DNA-binding response OmpR family regulator
MLRRTLNYISGICIGCVIGCMMLSVTSFAQNRSLSFRHIGKRDGLSHSNTVCILEDSRGFMWFGTSDGLNKYDGYTFTVYRNNPRDPHSISGNFIQAIVEDAKGDLWIATSGGGVSRFNRDQENFTQYKNEPGNVNSISGDEVTTLMLDHEGLLWIGTDNNGVDVYNEKDNSFIHYTHGKSNPASLTSNATTHIFEDHAHNVWVATRAGINVYDRKTKAFTRFQHDDKNPRSLSGDNAKVIFEDSRKQLWIGIWGAGLNKFNPATKDFEHFGHQHGLANDFVMAICESYDGDIWIGTENGGLNVLDKDTHEIYTHRHDDIDPGSLSINSVWSLYKDRGGNMWVGTFSGGINLLSKDGSRFTHYRHTSSPASLSNNKVLHIFEDSKKNIWIGTDGGGVNLFDRRTGTFKHFLHDPNNPASICGNYVLNVNEDSNGNFWIGTWSDGLTVYNPGRNTYVHYKYDPKDSTGINCNNAWAFLEDSHKNIWIGTFYGGLNLFNPKDSSFTHFVHDDNDPNSISGNKVYLVFEDSQGRIWVGTQGNGLNLFDPVTRKFTAFQHQDGVNSISNNAVNQMYEDKNGNFWIGTMSGLNYLDMKTRKFKVYRTTDGLPSDAIYGILEDSKGNLWLGTNNGLSKFTPSTGRFKNFGIADGLRCTEFKQSAFLKGSNGAMYFGGEEGFIEFFPDSIKSESFQVPIVLTGFQLFNVPVSIADSVNNSPLQKSITETHNITLSHDASVISFEFASLNYISNERKVYSYMLEGFDKQWSVERDIRSVTYTNLDPGQYIFKVRGRDSEGNWTTDTLQLNLTITPPFWLTWWFITSVVLLVMGTVFLGYRARMRSMQKLQEALEKEVNERTAEAIERKEILEAQTEDMQTLNEQLQEQTNFLQSINEEIQLQREEAEAARKEAERANQAKSIFLATMSHEIRTPMNGVLGMAALLAETKLTAEQQEYTNTIRGSGEALLTVINDILDFSKIESGNLELDSHAFSLRQCIEDVMDVFSGKAAQKGLDLLYYIDPLIPDQIISDSHRLRQILINLIGNAMKFTHQGEIYIGVDLLGSADDKLELSFHVRDTGIGIPSDKLSRLFKAFSQVDSSTTRKYGGTGLGLVISQRLVELMGGAIGVESEPGVGTTFTFTLNGMVSSESQTTPAVVEGDHAGKRVLLVDDNATNLAILKSQMEQWKLIPVLASSGQAALDILSSGSVRFDLVITDMQMPDRDGVQLTQAIKKNHADLPVILLSSVGDENKKQYTDLFAVVLNKPVRQQALYRAVQTALQPVQKTVVAEDTAPKQLLSEEFAKRYPLRILVAEDNPVNQKLTTRILSKLGYNDVQVAQNGLEALEKFDEDDFNVILMDVQMPEMDGLEATRMIRLKRYHQPIIISMTANAMQGDRDECMKAGMDDYVSKPVKLEALVAVLEKWALHMQANEGSITI